MGNCNDSEASFPGRGQSGGKPVSLGIVVMDAVQHNQAGGAARIVFIIITSLIIRRLRIINPRRLAHSPSANGRMLRVRAHEEARVGFLLGGIVRLVGLGP